MRVWECYSMRVSGYESMGVPACKCIPSPIHGHSGTLILNLFFQMFPAGMDITELSAEKEDISRIVYP